MAEESTEELQPTPQHSGSVEDMFGLGESDPAPEEMGAPDDDAGPDSAGSPAEPPVQEEKAEAKQDDPNEQISNLNNALKQQRIEQKRLKDELQQTKLQAESMARVKAELDEWRQQQQAQQEQQQELSQFEEDPITYLKQRQDKMLEMQQNTQQMTQQQEQAMAQMQQFASHVEGLKKEFMKDHPDYLDAYQHVYDGRMKEFEALGLTDPSMAEQQFGMEALALSQYAVQHGLNPAELVYNLAKQKGYTGKKQEQQQEQQPNLQQKVEQLNKGQQASQSLSGMSSSPDDSPLSLAGVQDMSDEEFDKLWADYEAAERH